MLRLSKMTDYGTLILVQLARAPEAIHTASEIASQTRLGLPTVSKLMKRLAKADLVSSSRGANGGYQLSSDAETITAADIIDALEGPLAITECSTHESQCSIESSCSMGNHWQQINEAIRQALLDINLAQLARPQAVPLFHMQRSDKPNEVTVSASS